MDESLSNISQTIKEMELGSLALGKKEGNQDNSTGISLQKNTMSKDVKPEDFR